MSGLRLLACASLLGLASPASAEPARGVALVNLAPPSAPIGRELDRLRAELVTAGLRPLARGALRDALETPLAPSGTPAPLVLGRAALDGARAAYAEFEFKEALERLAELDRAVVALPPSRPVIALLADRQILAGVILAGDDRAAAARDAFRAAHALDPARDRLAAATYPPDVVTAYADALAANPGRGELAIGDLPVDASLFIDGRPARRPLELVEGQHWVVATGPGRAAAGAFVRVKAGGRTAIELPLRRLPAEARAAELRAALIDRPIDESALRAAAAELAALADVAYLVVVRRRADRSEAALFEVARGALGPFGPLDATRLAPAPAAGPAGPLGGGERPDDDQAWYQAWWGKTLLIGGGAMVAGAIVFAVAASGSDDASGATVGDWCFEGQGCAR